ncbi:Mu transposase C-terminal domain-containing protein [Parafrankia soli]|uniref:Mu transposase C-terminal domain-containing protein n=1 Tax=Parafrankia soli TaxID=2599596 RepID=UPI003B58901D
MEGLPAAAVEAASWWESHIAEVVYGLRPDAPAGSRPRPQYDPERTSLTEREKTKAAELSAAGRPVPASTVKHRRQRWEAHGLAGLVDRRVARRMRPAGRADDRVVEAMRQAIGEATGASSRTVGFVIWRTREILAEAGYDGPVPSDRTFYRLFGTLSHGRHVTGSASTRRSLAGRPEGMFGSLQPAAPGEVVQVDSTPLDVLVLLDDGVPGRVELTGMIDMATRVVPAAVLRPSTKSVDVSVLLARALTPEPVRPGWPEALKMAHSVLPYERLLAIDERLEQAAARPVIVPDTVVIDHGSVFVSAAFRSACRHLGISIQPAHLGSGAEKGHIERYFGSVGSLFAQFASGYAGRSPDRRGRHVEDQPLWSMAELQELLDEWLVAFWLNRPHDGLRDPEHPGRAFTPNEKYAALVEAAGYVPVALGPDDYIELLPVSWRTVNAYGIKLARRSYDSEDLNPLRLQPSGVREKKNLWEVRHDPYDISRVHVRGPDGWITVFWKYLDRAPVPFGELAWDHARRGLGREATEEQIADTVATLLRRANAGPERREKPTMSNRDRRVAARTRAATPPAGGKRDQPASGGPAQPDATAEQAAEKDAPLAKVIPMPIFDPFAEADKRW